jgi:hypothetical protein
MNLLPQDSAGQQRVQVVLDRMARIAGLRA